MDWLKIEPTLFKACITSELIMYSWDITEILRRIKMLTLALSCPLLGCYGSSRYNVMCLLEPWQEIVTALVALWAQSFNEICSSISWKLWLFSSNWACPAGFLLTADILIHVRFITLIYFLHSITFSLLLFKEHQLCGLNWRMLNLCAETLPLVMIVCLLNLLMHLFPSMKKFLLKVSETQGQKR